MPTLSRRVTDAPSSATVLIADVAADMRARGADVLDFAGGRAAEGTPAFISGAAVRALETGDSHQTHAQGTRAFREACALKLRRDNGMVANPETEIIATMGCKQGLMISLFAAIEAGDEVIVEDPGFVSYAPTIGFCGGVAVPVRLRAENRFRWDPAEVEAAVTSRTRAIVLCSPQNPTGAVHAAADLDAVAGIARRHDLFVIADSIYERVAWAGRPFLPISARPGMAERTITLMGLTKSCAMGGWRIGFVHAAPVVIESMVTLQQHLITCVSALAQAAGTAALNAGAVDVVRAMWEDWERRCAYVTGALAAVPGVVCRMPEAGYYAWTDVRAFDVPSVELAETIMREHGVAVVPGSAFGPEGEGYLRITCVRSWDEIHVAVPRLQAALSTLSAVR